MEEYIKVTGKKPDDFLFSKSTGSLRRTMHRVRKRTDVKTRATPQAMRRTLATNLHLRGADISTIKSQMGHKDEATTLASYIKIGPELHRQKYDRYAPIYQDSQMDRHIKKFVTGEFTFGGDPLSVEASHYKPEMNHLLSVQEQLQAYAELLRQREEELKAVIKAPPQAALPVVVDGEPADQPKRPRQGASAKEKKTKDKPKGGTRKAADKLKSDSSTPKRGRGRPRKMPSLELTPRQRSVLKSLKKGAIPLTNALYRNISEVSRNIAASDIMALCKIGVLERDPSKAGRSTQYLLTNFGLAAVC